MMVTLGEWRVWRIRVANVVEHLHDLRYNTHDVKNVYDATPVRRETYRQEFVSSVKWRESCRLSLAVAS